MHGGERSADSVAGIGADLEKDAADTWLRGKRAPLAVIQDMDDYTYDPEDEGYQPDPEDWIPLGHGVSLIRHLFPDGSQAILWAIEQPGGRRIGGL